MKEQPLKMLRPLVMFALIPTLAGCSTSHRFKDSWTNPDVADEPFGKVMVLVADPDSSGRRWAEDLICNTMALQGINCAPSVEVLPKLHDLNNESKVIKALKGSGCDGVLTIAIAKDREHNTAAWGAGWGVAHLVDRDAGRAVAAIGLLSYAGSKNLELALELWQSETLTQVWRATTASYAPGSQKKETEELAKFLAAELNEAGHGAP
jgi:hypothetical protein